MRGVAEIEALAAMPIAIGQRERARGDRKRLLRRIAGLRLSLARQHLRNVVVEIHGFDSRRSVLARATEPDGTRCLPGGVPEVPEVQKA
jgi:hypothetical protein